jgi:hypothetical protein
LQYLENSLLSLRAVHYTLKGPTAGPEIQLFPMVHIGSAAFYAQVRSRLERCDVILYEGVRSPKVRILSLSYQLAARRKRLRLIGQNESLQLNSLPGQLIHADVSSLEFHTEWARIPLRYRLLLALGAPLYGAYLYLTATRESIGRHLSLDDQSSRDEALRREEWQGVDEAIVTTRDAKLLSRLETLISAEGSYPIIGILYGAGHMPAITDLLMGKYHYRVSASEWLDVFEYEFT